MLPATLAINLAGLCAFFAIIVSASLIAKHQRNFTKPSEQAKICGILWMVPIYAVDSYLSLRLKGAALYLGLLRDCYEGYALYLFLALLISYLGEGDEYIVVSLLEKCPPRAHAFPFNLFTRAPVPHGRDFLRWAKRGTLQYSVIKPATAMVAIILYPLGWYNEGSFDPRDSYVYLTIIVNISVIHAFYCLGVFYMELKGPLAPHDAVPKFLCIKAVLFLSYWQSVVIAGLGKFSLIRPTGSWSREEVEVGLQDALICLEMMLVSIAHTSAFSAEPYIGAAPPWANRVAAASRWESHFAHDSAVRDFNEVMPVLLPSSFKPGPARTTTRIPLSEQLERQGLHLNAPVEPLITVPRRRDDAPEAVPLLQVRAAAPHDFGGEGVGEGSGMKGLRTSLLRPQG